MNISIHHSETICNSLRENHLYEICQNQNRTMCRLFFWQCSVLIINEQLKKMHKKQRQPTPKEL